MCPTAPICCYFKEGGIEAFYAYCRATWFPQVVTFTGFAPTAPQNADKTKEEIRASLVKVLNSINEDREDLCELIRASRDPHLLWFKMTAFKAALNPAELKNVRYN